jgi:hypothetical protein
MQAIQDFETMDLTIRKEEKIEVETFVQTKFFDPSKDKYVSKKNDLTEKNSLSAAIAPMISEFDSLLKDRANHFDHLRTMKEKIIALFKDESVSASDKTRKNWIDTVTKCKDLQSLTSKMTNLYLGGAGLSQAAFAKKGVDF